MGNWGIGGQGGNRQSLISSLTDQYGRVENSCTALPSKSQPSRSTLRILKTVSAIALEGIGL